MGVTGPIDRGPLESHTGGPAGVADLLADMGRPG